MKKKTSLFLTLIFFLLTLPKVISAEELDKYADPVPIVSSGSFICKTWGGTKMDSFNVNGGSLTAASFSLSQGSVIYNLTGFCNIGDTVSLDISGSQWDMNGYAVALDNNQLIISIRYLNENGDDIGDAHIYDSGKSNAPSLSSSLSGTIPANTTTIIMDGVFSCTWSSANAKPTETVGVYVTLTVGSAAITTPPTKPPTPQAPTATPAPTPSSPPKAYEPEPTPDQTGPYSIVRFGDLTGEVSVLRAGEDEDAYFPAELDTPLYPGDRIRTKSRSGAILSFADMTTFVMKEDSVIILDIAEERESKIELVAGNVWINLKKLIENGSLEVEMSQACAGIKGTILAAKVTDEGDEVYLFTSSAEITSKITGKTVILKPGQMAITDHKGKIKVHDFDIEAEAKKLGISMKDLKADGYKSTSKIWLLWFVFFFVVITISIVLILFLIRKKHKLLQSAFCTNCGVSVRTGQRFCNICGNKLQ